MGMLAFAEVWRLWELSGEDLVVALALADLADDRGHGEVDVTVIMRKARVHPLERLECILESLRVDGLLMWLFDNSLLVYTLQLETPHLDEIRERILTVPRILLKHREQQTPNPPITPIARESRINGYVYILKCGQYYKIGQTKHLNSRLTQLAIQLPEKPEIIHTIICRDACNPMNLEKLIHNRMASRRMNGEWFALEEHDIRALKRITMYHDDPLTKMYELYMTVEDRQQKGQP